MKARDQDISDETPARELLHTYVEAMAVREGWEDALEGKAMNPQAEKVLPLVHDLVVETFNQSYAKAYEFTHKRKSQLAHVKSQSSKPTKERDDHER